MHDWAASCVTQWCRITVIIEDYSKTPNPTKQSQRLHQQTSIYAIDLAHQYFPNTFSLHRPLTILADPFHSYFSNPLPYVNRTKVSKLYKHQVYTIILINIIRSATTRSPDAIPKKWPASDFYSQLLNTTLPNSKRSRTFTNSEEKSHWTRTAISDARPPSRTWA